MHTPTRHPPSRRLVPSSIATSVALLLALTACGWPVIPIGGGAPGRPTLSGTDTLTGCPAPTQTVRWPSAPAAIITTPFSSNPVTIHTGQTLEVSLPFGHVWQIQADQGQSVLALDTPAGYGDGGASRCIWHFTAHQAGHVVLAFTMKALCPAHTACPLYTAILRASVTVV